MDTVREQIELEHRRIRSRRVILSSLLIVVAGGILFVVVFLGAVIAGAGPKIPTRLPMPVVQTVAPVAVDQTTTTVSALPPATAPPVVSTTTAPPAATTTTTPAPPPTTTVPTTAPVPPVAVGAGPTTSTSCTVSIAGLGTYGGTGGECEAISAMNPGGPTPIGSQTDPVNSFVPPPPPPGVLSLGAAGPGAPTTIPSTAP